MRAVIFDSPGAAEVLYVGDAPSPALGNDDLRIRVFATAVNRADLLQRRGLYPPPPGASPILGLECAGEVMEVGRAVTGWKRGDRVMALLVGGGYAEEVVAPASWATHVPYQLSVLDAAAVPEAFLTAHLNLFHIGKLGLGQTALIHGGSGGVGSAAIQLVKEAGARSIVTAGSDERCARCRELGADVAINYRTDDFAAFARDATDGRGVDVVLDFVGAAYLPRNLAALADGGTLAVIGLMGGSVVDLDLGHLLRHRIAIVGSTLRGLPAADKAALVHAFTQRFGIAVAAGRVRPIVDRVLPLDRAAEAHRVLEAGEAFGKIVLQVTE